MQQQMQQIQQMQQQMQQLHEMVQMADAQSAAMAAQGSADRAAAAQGEDGSSMRQTTGSDGDDTGMLEGPLKGSTGGSSLTGSWQGQVGGSSWQEAWKGMGSSFSQDLGGGFPAGVLPKAAGGAPSASAFDWPGSGDTGVADDEPSYESFKWGSSSGSGMSASEFDDWINDLNSGTLDGMSQFGSSKKVPALRVPPLRAGPYDAAGYGKGSLQSQFGEPQQSSPHTNVFIGNLSYSASEQQLRELFSTCGTVTSCRVLTDPTTGKSKGSGFVRFTTQEEARKAIQTFNQHEGMVVKMADNDKGKGGGRASRGRDNLYLTGLPGSDLDEEGLKSIFAQLGLTIVRCRIFPDTRGTGVCAAMVQVLDQEQAEVAIQNLHGRGKISCTYAVDKRPDPMTPLVVKYAGSAEAESDNLYITGLPSPQVEVNSLKQVFAHLGLTVVRCRTLVDNRDKGFSAALVQVASPAEAATAIDMFSGKLAHAIGLMADHSVEPAGNTAHATPPHGNLFVGHLPEEVTESSLQEVFGCFGPIISVRVTVDLQTGRSKGSGFVKFESPDDAARAIEALHGQGGILVKYADYDLGSSPKGKGKSKESKGEGKGEGKGEDDWSPQRRPNSATAKLVPAKFPAKGVPVSESKVPAVAESKVPAGAAALASQQRLQRETMSLKYFSFDEAPCQSIFMTGLPSPEGEAATLLQMFMGIGLKVDQIKMVPDLRGIGSSAAVVQFTSNEEAEYAISTLNGKRPADFGLTFNPLPASQRRAEESIEAWKSTATKWFKIAFKDGVDKVSDHVFLSGLNWWTDQDALQSMFAGLEMNIAWSKLYFDGAWKGGALIQLDSEDDALLAVMALSRY